MVQEAMLMSKKSPENWASATADLDILLDLVDMLQHKIGLSNQLLITDLVEIHSQCRGSVNPS